jgi:hypothetical protein
MLIDLLVMFQVQILYYKQDLMIILNYNVTKCHIIYIRRQIKLYAFYTGINSYLCLYVVLS